MTSSFLQVDMNGTDNLKRSSTQSSFGKGLKRSDSFVEEERHQKRRHDILACLEEGTEGCITLVGSIDDIDRPIVAFVRMAEAIALPNTIEVIFKLTICKKIYSFYLGQPSSSVCHHHSDSNDGHGV